MHLWCVPEHDGPRKQTNRGFWRDAPDTCWVIPENNKPGIPSFADSSLSSLAMGANRQAGTVLAPGAQCPAFVMVRPGFLERNVLLLRLAFVAAYEDNCFGIAKGAAYSLLLAVFPVLTTLASILVQARAESLVRVLASFVREVVPPGTEDLVLSRLREHGSKPVSLPIFASLLALWAGSGAMISLMEGFQAAYRIPVSRPFLKQRAMAIFLVFIAAVPAVLASSLILSGDRIERAILDWREMPEISAPVQLAWRASRYLVAFCITTLVTGLLYYFGPNHRMEPEHWAESVGRRIWRVWPGAVVATVLWLITTAGFNWYVHHLANYNFFYGSIGAVIVLTIWLYLIACIALIGCEFNAERERAACILPTA
jgi:membrane protein